MSPQQCWACGREIPPGEGVQRTITTRQFGFLGLPANHTEAVRFCTGCAQRQIELEQATAEAEAREDERAADKAKSEASGCGCMVLIIIGVVTSGLFFFA